MKAVVCYRNGKLDSASYRTRVDILREAAQAICLYCRIKGDPRDCINDPGFQQDNVLRFIHEFPEPGDDVVCGAGEIWVLINAEPAPEKTSRTHIVHGWMIEAAQRILRKLHLDYLGLRMEDALAHIIANSFYDHRTAEEIEEANL